MKTKTLLRCIIVTFALITFSSTTAKAFTPYTWDIIYGWDNNLPTTLNKFNQSNFRNSWDGTNGRFEMWDARYMFLKRDVSDAYWFSGDNYMEFSVYVDNSDWTSHDMSGSIMMYLSMDNTGVSGDYNSPNAKFTAIQFFPLTGRVVLLQKNNNVETYNQTVELGRNMTFNRKTFKVYNQGGVLDVYVFNEDGSTILHPFVAKTLTVPPGEVGISSDCNGMTRIFGYNVKNIVDAPAKLADAISVTSVSLDKTTATINMVEQLKLTPTALPAAATDKDVNWISSNPGFATVDASGNVKPIAPGTSTITATTLDGGKTASCVVTVIAVPAGDVSTFTLPALTTTIYENDFSDKNSAASQMWQIVSPGFINYGVLGGASNWQNLPVDFTGNYQIKITMSMEERSWHSSSIKFNVNNSDVNYYEINTQMTGVNIKKVIDGVSADLVNLTAEKFRPNYTYTINQFGNNLEIYRDIPQGERKNLVAITDNSIKSGSIAFKASDQWSHSINYIKVTAIYNVATSQNNLSIVGGKVYPNITSGMVNLSYKNIQSVEVIGLDGKACKKLTVQPNVIDLSSMANGVYLLKISTKEGLFVEKVVKK